MLLVLTHSSDFTTDDVLGRIPDVPVFRFNIDLWRNYRWAIGADRFEIEDPTGRLCREEDVRAVYLRKLLFDPVFVDTPAGGNEESWCRSELMEVWLGLRDWAHETGRLALIKPSVRGSWSKIRQMKAAKLFFKIPEWRVVHGRLSGLADDVVIKTLAAANIGKGSVVTVRAADERRLSPDYPWFLQTRVSAASHDVTVAWVDGEFFAYEMERSGFHGEDCRLSSVHGSAQWTPCELNSEERLAISSFMNHVGLDFGRLDYLRENGTLWFLEVNPNGQFAWLDPHGDSGLLNAVAAAIRKVWLRNAP